jgi:EF-P beta-lysylation protein EpmB
MPMPVHSPSPPAAPAASGARWKRELADAVRDPAELCRLLDLDPAVVGPAAAPGSGFPLLVPRGFVARMRPGDPADPLLLQVLPRPEEGEQVAGFTADPLAEQQARRAGGLIQKYAGRALLLLTGGCAVNCRYCFRREFPYADSGANPAGISLALEELAADPSIHEVILSGGDPLLLDDRPLARLVADLGAIPHLRRLRIHSRLPVVLPSRLTAALTALLAASRLAVSLVIHANHASELDDAVARGLAEIAGSVPLRFNQAVLLRGVNDDADVLAALSERLIDLGITPYYLHLLDPVRGAAAFAVSEARGRELIDQLRRRLPGYAVPRLAREQPGEPAKVWIA